MGFINVNFFFILVSVCYKILGDILFYCTFYGSELYKACEFSVIFILCNFADSITCIITICFFFLIYFFSLTQYWFAWQNIWWKFEWEITKIFFPYANISIQIETYCRFPSRLHLNHLKNKSYIDDSKSDLWLLITYPQCNNTQSKHVSDKSHLFMIPWLNIDFLNILC